MEYTSGTRDCPADHSEDAGVKCNGTYMYIISSCSGINHWLLQHRSNTSIGIIIIKVSVLHVCKSKSPGVTVFGVITQTFYVTYTYSKFKAIICNNNVIIIYNLI